MILWQVPQSTLKAPSCKDENMRAVWPNVFCNGSTDTASAGISAIPCVNGWTRLKDERYLPFLFANPTASSNNLTQLSTWPVKCHKEKRKALFFCHKHIPWCPNTTPTPTSSLCDRQGLWQDQNIEEPLLLPPPPFSLSGSPSPGSSLPGGTAAAAASRENLNILLRFTSFSLTPSPFSQGGESGPKTLSLSPRRAFLTLLVRSGARRADREEAGAVEAPSVRREAADVAAALGAGCEWGTRRGAAPSQPQPRSPNLFSLPSPQVESHL